MAIAGICLLLLVLSSAIVWAWRMQSGPIVDAFGVKGSAFQIKERSIACEKVRIGQKAQCVFHLFNASSDARHIMNVRPGCSCTTVTHFTEYVAPRSWGDVTVEIDTTRKAGHRSSSLLIETDDPLRPRINTMVTCWVLPAVEMRPERLRFIAEGLAGNSRSQTVEVVGLYRDEKIEIEDVVSSDPMISAASADSAKGEALLLNVTVNNNISSGTTVAYMTVGIKGSAQENVRLPVTVTKELTIKAEPAILKLSVSNNTLQTAEFMVRALTGSPLEIGSVALPTRVGRVDQRKRAPDEVLVQLLDLKVTNAINGKHVCVTTNHGELRVPIVVGAQAGPRLAEQPRLAPAFQSPPTR